MSKIKSEKFNEKDQQCYVKNSVIKIASGTHDLKYVKINGRIQIDLYNYFRKDVNLPSYKLDYVASLHRRLCQKYDYDEKTGKTRIYSRKFAILNNNIFV